MGDSFPFPLSGAVAPASASASASAPVLPPPPSMPSLSGMPPVYAFPVISPPSTGGLSRMLASTSTSAAAAAASDAASASAAAEIEAEEELRAQLAVIDGISGGGGGGGGGDVFVPVDDERESERERGHDDDDEGEGEEEEEDESEKEESDEEDEAGWVASAASGMLGMQVPVSEAAAVIHTAEQRAKKILEDQLVAVDAEDEEEEDGASVTEDGASEAEAEGPVSQEESEREDEEDSGADDGDSEDDDKEEDEDEEDEEDEEAEDDKEEEEDDEDEEEEIAAVEFFKMCNLVNKRAARYTAKRGKKGKKGKKVAIARVRAKIVLKEGESDADPDMRGKKVNCQLRGFTALVFAAVYARRRDGISIANIKKFACATVRDKTNAFYIAHRIGGEHARLRLEGYVTEVMIQKNICRGNYKANYVKAGFVDYMHGRYYIGDKVESIDFSIARAPRSSRRAPASPASPTSTSASTSTSNKKRSRDAEEPASAAAATAADAPTSPVRKRSRDARPRDDQPLEAKPRERVACAGCGGVAALCLPHCGHFICIPCFGGNVFDHRKWGKLVLCREKDCGIPTSVRFAVGL